MKIARLIFFSSLPLLWAGCKDFGEQPKLPTAVQVSIADVSVVEGATALLVISLSKASDSEVVFEFASQSGSATEGSDFDSVSGSDTIQAGITKDTIAIATIDDSTPEGTETFSLWLSALGSAEFADSVATVTITDNDSVALVSFGTDIKPLLDSRCVSCHGSGLSSGGLTIGTATWSEVRNASGDNGQIIVVNNSAASNLYLKTTSPPPFGEQMPAVGTKLTITEKQKIKDWIDQGANNN